MDNRGNILYGFLILNFFEDILNLYACKLQHLKGCLSKNHAECEEYGNDCNANLGVPMSADLIGYVEYVDEYDDCKEQQNCKDDANDEPCGYACGSSVLDNSNHNIVSHFGPTNDLCTLGKYCIFGIGFAGVCNTVYHPGSSILCIVDNKCLDRSFKFGLFSFAIVAIGEHESAICIAFCLNKNEA